MLQKDAHSYVYKINGVDVVRVYEPNEAGEYEVAVIGLYGTYDINLQYKFTGYYNGMGIATSTDEQVRLPLNPNYQDQGKDFSALLTYNSSDQLIVEKSWHADVYRLASTNDDKATRKSLKEELDAYVTLQMFKLPTLKDNVNLSANMGKPFGESRLSYTVQSDMMSAMQNRPLPLESQSFMETFDKVAQDCFDMLASKKVYNAPDTYGNLFHKMGSWARSRNPAEADDAQEQADDIVASITPDEFKKSLVAKLMSFAGLAKGSESVPLPQFGKTLPRTYYTRANKKGG
jgi:regulation of enolase protein 1 (concanavalin A-like superfamily)